VQNHASNTVLGSNSAHFLDFSAFQFFLTAAKGSFWQNLGYLSIFGLSALFGYFVVFLGLYELVQDKKNMLQGYQCPNISDYLLT
jgi:hypothetical protein